MPLRVTETCLRDGHQSLMATRLRTEEILPILEKMDKAGYYSMEVWGGATFDACIRFLNEDPWERLRQIRARVKNTKLQMLLRGQNLLGYRHYADDVVEEFVKKSLENGIDIIRVFDALNDFRNLETAIKAIKKYKGHCQGCIAYTTSEIHTVDYFVEKILELEKMGVDSLCIKDMSGILLPETGYELVKRIKEVTKLPLSIHSHCTSGIAEMLYMRAIDAGVDIIDTTISPFSGGIGQPATEVYAHVLKGTARDPKLDTHLLDEIADYFKLIDTTISPFSGGIGQPATEVYAHVLKGTARDPKLDTHLLDEIADYFKPIKEKYRAMGFFNPKVMERDPKGLSYQVPGGMLSNLISQLEQQKALDKYDEVLSEIPRVRKDMGYPPLVTPMSQMVGTQAVFNVILGGRYKAVPKEIRDYAKGLYGKSPVSMDKEIQKEIIGDVEPITCRPADLLEPELEKLKNELGDLASSMEDVLMYALFPDNGKKFLENRKKEAEMAKVKEAAQEKEIEENIIAETEIDDETVVGMVALAHIMSKDRYHQYRIVDIVEI